MGAIGVMHWGLLLVCAQFVVNAAALELREICRDGKGYTLNPLDPCGRIYYFCKRDGSGARLTCTRPGDAFDLLDTKRCVSKSSLDACRPTTTPKPTTPKPTTPKPTPTRPGIDLRNICTGRMGYTLDPVRPCGPVYYYCKRDGSGARLTCSRDNYAFDLGTERCVASSSLASCRPSCENGETYLECGNKHCERTCADRGPKACTLQCGPPGCSCKPGYVRPALGSRVCVPQQSCSLQPSEKPPVTFPTKKPTAVSNNQSPECAGKSDGDFEDPAKACSNGYISCVGGIVFHRNCPGRLVFDKISYSCQLSRYTEACGGKATTTAKPTAAEPTDAPAFDCTGNEDGLFAVFPGCSGTYFACVGGKTTQLECPDGLRFDQPNQQCDYERYIQACGGEATVKAEPTTKGPTLPPEVDCPNLPNGKYPNPWTPCSSDFFVCLAGVEHKIDCAKGTFFDEVSGDCLFERYVGACGGKPTEKPPPTKPVPFNPPDFDCTSKDDGYYPDPKEPCNAVFFSCTGGFARELTCPGITLFDVKSGDCLLALYVEACGGESTKRPVVTPRPLPPDTPDFDCSNRGDGRYPDPTNPCSDVFFVCVGAHTYPFWCPGSSRFDKLSTDCLLPQYIPECGGVATERTEPPPTSPPKQPSDFNCVDRDLANFPDPDKKCSQVYFACAGGPFALAQSCALNTFYDAEFDRCDFFDNIPVCSGKPRPEPTTTTTAAPPKTRPDFDCLSRDVGNFADPENACSHVFIACGADGTALEQTCPGKLFFDQESNECKYRGDVQGCQ